MITLAIVLGVILGYLAIGFSITCVVAYSDQLKDPADKAKEQAALITIIWPIALVIFAADWLFDQPYKIQLRTQKRKALKKEGEV